MSQGAIYIVAALIFGLLLPFIKNAFHEWWQVGALAALYFSAARLIAFLVDRRAKGKAMRGR